VLVAELFVGLSNGVASCSGHCVRENRETNFWEVLEPQKHNVLEIIVLGTMFF
jgi:hypothetical protein